MLLIESIYTKLLTHPTATKYALPVSSENIFFWDAEKQIKSIEEAFTVLRERERQVLSVRFGLIDGYFHSLEETDCFFKVTRERIRQIEGRALSKIRNWYHHQEKLKLYITNQKEDDSLT